MTEITEQEAREAAARLRMWDAGKPPSRIYATADDPIEAANNDAWDLARLHVQELDRRDAERKQKTTMQPSIALTKEWFENIGNDVGAILISHQNLIYEIEFAAGTPGVGIDLATYKESGVSLVNLPTINTTAKLYRLIELLKEE